MDILSLSGLVGGITACIAYLLLVTEKVAIKGYAAMSLIATVLLTTSLFAQFNAGTAIMQVFFGTVSIYALVKEYLPYDPRSIP